MQTEAEIFDTFLTKNELFKLFKNVKRVQLAFLIEKSGANDPLAAVIWGFSEFRQIFWPNYLKIV